MMLKIEAVKFHIKFYTFSTEYFIHLSISTKNKKIHDRIRIWIKISFMSSFKTHVNYLYSLLPQPWKSFSLFIYFLYVICTHRYTCVCVCVCMPMCAYVYAHHWLGSKYENVVYYWDYITSLNIRWIYKWMNKKIWSVYINYIHIYTFILFNSEEKFKRIAEK